MKRMMVALVVVMAAAPVVAGTVGFVDAERAVQEVAEGRAKLAELDAWAKPRAEQVGRAQKEAAELNREMQQKRSVASGDVVAELEQRLREAARAFEDARRTYERELTKKQDELLSDVAIKVGTVASEYGEANGFDAIFVLNAQPLIYVSDTADLTDTVIRLYDERFPYPAE